MTIQKINNYLYARSNIYFDNECCFCGRPYISLTAHRDKDKFWEENTITIAIHDMDDFDYGLIYKTNPDDFTNVLRELINWMRDHEQGISIYDDILDIFSFFPDCECERKIW